jgi:hypothetical protein
MEIHSDIHTLYIHTSLCRIMILLCSVLLTEVLTLDLGSLSLSFRPVVGMELESLVSLPAKLVCFGLDPSIITSKFHFYFFNLTYILGLFLKRIQIGHFPCIDVTRYD